MLSAVVIAVLSGCLRLPQNDVAVQVDGAAPFETESLPCASLASSAALRDEASPVGSVRVVVDRAEQVIGDTFDYEVSGTTTVTLDDEKVRYDWTCLTSYALDGSSMDATMLSFQMQPS